MSTIKVGYINILETSTVTVTSENVDYPAYRLYDRNINKLYKGTSTTDHTIKIQQQGTIQSVNALYIPEGHNLDGVSISVQYSDDDSTYIAVDTWIQSGNDQIFRQFSTTYDNKVYWKIIFSNLTNYLNLTECYLTNLYEFTRSPSYGSTINYNKFNIYRSESRSGVPHYLYNGKSRKIISYTLNNILKNERDEIVKWLDEWSGCKPFVFVDIDNNVFFAELTQEISFSYLHNRYSTNFSVMEVI